MELIKKARSQNRLSNKKGKELVILLGHGDYYPFRLII